MDFFYFQFVFEEGKEDTKGREEKIKDCQDDFGLENSDFMS